MKKLFFFLVIFTNSFFLSSCDKKENLSDNPTGCSCPNIMECEADCPCGCQG